MIQSIWPLGDDGAADGGDGGGNGDDVAGLLEVNFLDINWEIFLFIGKFTFYLPISYCLPGVTNWPNFAYREILFTLSTSLE